MKTMSRILFFAWLASQPSVSFAQAGSLDSLFAKAARFPAESVYLHCNSYSVLAGDSVFWAAYVLNDGQPSGFSKDLYVEFFSQKGQLITRKIFPVVNGLSLGQLGIPEYLPSGQYWLRAYTRYQLNFDSSNLFLSPIAVFNQKNHSSIGFDLRRKPVANQLITNRDHLLMVSNTVDTALLCHLDADPGCLLLGKPLNVVMASYHQPVMKASFCLSRDKPWQDLSFNTRTFQGNVDLMLFEGDKLLARQSINLTQLHSPEVQITPDTMSIYPGGYNSWSVYIKDLALYNCSVSVTDADKTVRPPTTIWQYSPPDPLYLNSALGGALPEIRFADTNFLSWTGFVRTTRGQPIRNSELVAILSNDSTAIDQPLVVPIDDDGRFNLGNAFFYDSAWLSFQLNGLEGDSRTKGMKLNIDTFTSPGFRVSRDAQWEDTVLEFPFLSQHRIDSASQAGAGSKELPPVLVKSNVRQELDNRYARGVFSEPTLYSFDLRTEKTVTNLWAYLRKNLPGFDGGLDIGQTPVLDGKDIIFYVDNQVVSLDDLEGWWFMEMAYVKAFPSLWIDETPYMKWITGLTTFRLKPSPTKMKIPYQSDHPVICIYTRKGSDIRTGWAGLSRVRIEGFSRIGKWTPGSGSHFTLYWEPLQHGNTFRIHFYNTDASRFRISIEGISKDGRIVHCERTISRAEGM